jgi:GTP-binding protein
MNKVYRNAHFLLSVPNVDLAPADRGLESAFAGRSNAGKSSAINAITDQKRLARTSKTPGRTQQLVFFEIDEQKRFVDLPGYGYAKVPARVQKQWQQFTERYFQKRISLRGVFLIMDIRRPITAFDEQMINWCAYCGKSLHVVLTKSDKLRYGAAKTALLDVGRQLDRINVPTTVQLFSAIAKTGIGDEIGRAHV